MKRFNKIKTINNAVATKGIKAELFKGEGYFYFVGDDVDRCETTSVMVVSLNELSLEQWVEEAEALAKEHKENV